MVNILFSKYNFDDEWAEPFIKNYIKAEDKVCIIAFSFSDEWISCKEEWHNSYDKDGGRYYDDLVKPFMHYGITENNITILNYFEDSSEKMKEDIKKSDVIFLTGGLPEKAVERVHEKGILESIKGCRVVVGSSAGALMQLNHYHISPDDDYDEFCYFDGIGLIDQTFYVEVHFENSDVQNQSIEKVLREKTDKVYAITNNGGIIVEDGKVQTLGEVEIFKR